MSVSGEVVVAIKGVDEASSAMDKIRASLGVFSGVIGDLGGGFTSLGNVISGFAGAGVMGAASAAVGEVVKGLKDCFSAAKESEAMFNALRITVEKQGSSWASAETGIRSFLDSMMKVSTFSDEKMAIALKILMDYGMDLDTAMKSLATTMDLAVGKQVDLELAAKAVGRAFEGNAGLLIRMGVEVTKSADDSVVFADAMAKLQEKFGGTAQRELESYAGKQKQVSEAMGELKEKIGAALIPVMSSFQDMMGNVIKGADQLVDQLGEAWKVFTEMPEVQKISESLAGAFADLQKGFGTVADELGKALLPIFKELWNVLKELWTAIQPVFEAFGKIWEALTGVSTEGKNAYTIFNLIADILKVTVVPALQGLVEVIKLVTPVIKLLAEGFKATVEVVAPFIKQLIESIGAFIAWLKEAFEGFYKWLVGGSFVQELMDAVFGVFKVGFDNLIKGITGWLGSIVDTITAWGKTITDIFTNLWNGIVSFLGGIWKQITDMVSSGAQQTQNTLQNLSNEVAQESIWPDMWNLMVKQTKEGIQGIVSETQRGLGGIESTFRSAAFSLSPAGGFARPRGGASAPSGPTHMTVNIPITVQSMTGEVKDLDNLTRMISRELGNAVKWRR